MADGLEAIERLRKAFPDAVVETGSYQDQHWVVVPKDRLVEIAAWLRDEPENAFDFLVDVTAVHWPEREDEPFDLVYHLYSYKTNDRLRLKTRTRIDEPVPTLSDIWAAADWNERETYDMFGIDFEGHPDLRRILMPDDYTDFPLRKEFPLYRG